ncbi:nucleoside-diphosphate kinase [Novosphingobium umbonatum]|uniref:Nucleoside-diphosphate kinase n=1 Tax=Novosphingobium umbonatum TaxID=1908524 RepID=A0A437N0K9_9SPHN|nr:GreA/GreB family elongation factor [Novosphingobium umbonatum]RVU03442.1 nucleoside-diphosphate kinase [Novosphingobium umbonatum]
MSVAFRRDGDEEHLEPSFEIPIPPGPNRVTARGLAQIHARVAALEAELATAEGEETQKPIRRQLRYWRTRQSTAELMPEPKGDVVEFGAQVLFRLNGQERSVTLVGDDEADPAAGLISASAPLARAMMGAEAGEYVAFGGREDAIEILALHIA